MHVAAPSCVFPATTSSMVQVGRLGPSAAGTACKDLSVIVLGNGWPHSRAGWSWSSGSGSGCCRGSRHGDGVESSRMLVICSCADGGRLARSKWLGWSGGLDIFQVQPVPRCLRLNSACCALAPASGFIPVDDRVKQGGLFAALLLSSASPECTVLGLFAFACSLAASALPNRWWQQNGTGSQNYHFTLLAQKSERAAEGHGGTMEVDCLGGPNLKISGVASLGAFTYQSDTLLGKLGLFAVGCILLVGLFNLGYSLVGTIDGQSVKRRVIRAQRHGDFRERMRRRLGEKELGFRVTYQEPAPRSYFSGGRASFGAQGHLEEGYGELRKPKPTSEPDDLVRHRAVRSGHLQQADLVDRTVRGGAGGEPRFAESGNGSAVTGVGDLPSMQTDRLELWASQPLSNPQVGSKERRSIAARPDGSLLSSHNGADKSSKASDMREGHDSRRLAVPRGSLRKWQEKDEVELKSRVEELRSKVLAAEHTRQAAMRSLAEEKRRSLELEVKISRQKESAAALEEEVRVLKESHDALLTSLRKKYSSSVAARAAAALLYQNWDSAGDGSVREMVY